MGEDDRLFFYEWIRKRREALGLTQTELAKQAECSVDMIRKIERNERRPARRLACRLAAVLQIHEHERIRFVNVALGTLSSSLLGQPIPPNGTFPGSSLPAQHTQLIGRDHELATMAQVLRDPGIRLLTLTGLGGVGKTRLAIQAVEENRLPFEDGVFFVALAAQRSTEFLPTAIADVLGISLNGQADPKVRLLSYLRSKHILIILDNYEHLLPDVSLLVDLLQYTQQVRVIVTSRVRLNIEEEHVFEVHGLPFPHADQVAESRTFSAVQLLLQSARRYQLRFEPSPQDEPHIVRICQLVEGLPLAIELAATWMRVMSCQEIAHEIAHNLAFLTASRREVAVRQHSMHAVFLYSWNLLNDDEQRILRQLSVCQGGFQRDAAKHIAGASLRLLRSLIDNSLLLHNDLERYDMHELMRQYAQERLHEAGEVVQTRRIHLTYYLILAQQAEPKLTSAERWEWLDRLEKEHANLRAALAWSLEDDQSVDGGLGLVSALTWFWYYGNHWRESRHWLEHLLTAERIENSTEIIAKALFARAFLNWLQGNYAMARTDAEQSVAIWRTLKNQHGLGFALIPLGLATLFCGDSTGAAEYLAESVAIWRAQENHWGLAFALSMLGYVPKMLEEAALALAHFEESAILWRQIGDVWGLTLALNNIGEVALVQGDIERARECFMESIALDQHQRYNKEAVAWALHNLGYIALEQGNVSQANSFFVESLALVEELGIVSQTVSELIGFAGIAEAEGYMQTVAQLLGAVAALSEQLSIPMFPVDRKYYERTLAAAQEQLDPVIFSALWSKGQSLTIDEALQLGKITFRCFS